MTPIVSIFTLLTLLAFTEGQHNYRGSDYYPYGSEYYYEGAPQGSYQKFFYPGSEMRALPVADSERQVRPLQLGLPKSFKKAMEPMQKQADGSMEAMKEAGDGMADMMQKPMEDMSDAMEGMMEEMRSADPTKQKSKDEKEEKEDPDKEQTTKKPVSSTAQPTEDSKGDAVPEPKRIEYPAPDFVDVQQQPRPRFFFEFFE